MKIFRIGLVVLTCAALVACSDVGSSTQQRSREIPEWYDDAKLGIFIHWGLPSVPGFANGKAFEPGELERSMLRSDTKPELPYSEWYQFSLQDEDGRTRSFHNQMYGERVPYQNFQQTYERQVKQNWDPQEWAEFFSDVGAQYVVLVSKHHDGYTLWPSDVVNPHQENWNSSQDLVGELGSAVRQLGMRYGLYYSTGLDWSFRLHGEDDFFTNFLLSAPLGQDYGDYVNDHLRELITRYRPTVLWGDIGYPSKGRRDELLDFYFSEVPEGVVNDRWEAFDFLTKIAELPGGAWLLKKLAIWSVEAEVDPLLDEPARYGFKTAEYANFPGIPPFKWESTRGLGGSFGYNRMEKEKDMLSGRELIHYVIDTVSKNGNVLINVGPDSRGNIPEIQRRPLREMGQWLKLNGQAIYATRPWSVFEGETLQGIPLRYTSTDDAVYALLFATPSDAVTLTEDMPPMASVELLGHGPLEFGLSEHGFRIELGAAQPSGQSAYVFKLTMQ